MEEKKVSQQTLWNRAHPDRAREIWNRANRKRAEKRKAEKAAQLAAQQRQEGGASK